MAAVSPSSTSKGLRSPVVTRGKSENDPYAYIINLLKYLTFYMQSSGGLKLLSLPHSSVPDCTTEHGPIIFFSRNY